MMDRTGDVITFVVQRITFLEMERKRDFLKREREKSARVGREGLERS